MVVTFGRAWEALPPCCATRSPRARPSSRRTSGWRAGSPRSTTKRQRAQGRVAWPAPLVVPWGGWLERLWLDVLAARKSVAPAAAAHARAGRVPVEADRRLRAVVADRRGRRGRAGCRRLVDRFTPGAAGGPSWRAWAGGDDDCAAFARWADEYSARLDVARRRRSRQQLPDWLARRAAPSRAGAAPRSLLAGFVELVAAATSACSARSRRRGWRSRIARSVREVGRIGVRVSLATTPRDEIDARAPVGARPRAGRSRRDDRHRDRGSRVATRGGPRARRRGALSRAAMAGARGDGASVQPLARRRGDRECRSSPRRSILIALAHAPLPMGRAAALLRSPYVAGDARRLAAPRADSSRLASRRATRDLARRRDRCARAASIRACGALAAGARAACAGRERDTARVDRILARVARGDRMAGRPVAVVGGVAGARRVGRVARAIRDARACGPRIAAREAVAALVALAGDHVFQPESPSRAGARSSAGSKRRGCRSTRCGSPGSPPRSGRRRRGRIRCFRCRGSASATRRTRRPRASSRTRRRSTAQWACGAPEVVFSCAKRVDDHARSVSLLVPPRLARSAAAAPVADQPRAGRSRRRRIWRRSATTHAPPLAKRHAGARRRSLDRSAERLPVPGDGAISPRRRSAGPNPSRGSRDASGGGSSMPRSLRSGATSAITRRSSRFRRRRSRRVSTPPPRPRCRRFRRRAGAVSRRPCAPGAARIASILRAWIEASSAAAPAVLRRGDRGEAPLSVGRSDLALRLDRVDALAGGGIAIIDYKTGARASRRPSGSTRARRRRRSVSTCWRSARTRRTRRSARPRTRSSSPASSMSAASPPTPEAWPDASRAEALRSRESPRLAGRRGALDAIARGARDRSARRALPPSRRAILGRPAGNCGRQALCRIGALAIDASAESGDG